MRNIKYDNSHNNLVYIRSVFVNEKSDMDTNFWNWWIGIGVFNISKYYSLPNFGCNLFFLFSNNLLRNYSKTLRQLI